ncbi:hypothetical protein G6F23_012579 [Rhizopus arrhizus]|nr:hypothetical protein G6F23_012579 [Rhizopus arrhizus]
MILAGGTGGHIFPGLAVARVLRERGVPVTWMGADGAMETRLVPQHDIAIDTLAITGLRGKGKLALLAAPWRLMRALRAAGMIIRKRQPRAVVAFGGFASGPGGMATRLHGLPLIVHEQNRAPGLTNRILSRYARRLLTGFPGTFAKREEFVGNPVRAEIAAIAPPEQRFADRHGRRLALTVSVTLMAVCSFLIAITPTAASIGIWAAVILLFARLLQGFATGGEYGASATYMSEAAIPGRRGFLSSFHYVTLVGGHVLAQLTLLLMLTFWGKPEISEWGWRIAFGIGGIAAVVVFWLRRGMDESLSESSIEAAREGKAQKSGSIAHSPATTR